MAQYTGFKDKNGLSISYGDKVKIEFPRSNGRPFIDYGVVSRTHSSREWVVKADGITYPISRQNGTIFEIVPK